MHKPLKVQNDRLEFNEGLGVTFQRTLRIPDDGRSYPLPPGLSAFPIRRVDDYPGRVPSEWGGRGGVFLPMYQREAMWICFHDQHWKPRAVKVGIGKVCAITGRRWVEQLHRHPQDYLVTPPQPWLDGIAAGHGSIRQFVAMPLGMGYTVEGQVTGEERFGGIQIKVFEPRPGLFPNQPDHFRCEEMDLCCAPAAPMQKKARSAGSMGLGAGGRMKQKIYPDPHGICTWDAGNTARIFVHIVNSELWREITGEEPPATPVTAKSYAAHGLPWFDLYDEGMSTVPSSPVLADVKSVKEMDQETFHHPLQDDDPVDPRRIKKLLLKMAAGVGVRDGDW